jgi:hypothetical protein
MVMGSSDVWSSEREDPHRRAKARGFLRWLGDDAARRAVVNNQIRLPPGVARGQVGIMLRSDPRSA